LMIHLYSQCHWFRWYCSSLLTGVLILLVFVFHGESFLSFVIFTTIWLSSHEPTHVSTYIYMNILIYILIEEALVCPSFVFVVKLTHNRKVHLMKFDVLR
jgi:hypothetical protein